MDNNYVNVYDELESIQKNHEILQSQVIQIASTMNQIIDRIQVIERRLIKENPGDINTLYQNWDKKQNG